MERPFGAVAGSSSPMLGGVVDVDVTSYPSSYTLTAREMMPYHFDHWEIARYTGVCYDIADRMSDMTAPVLTVSNHEAEGVVSGRLVMRAVFMTAGGGGDDPDDDTYVLTTDIQPNRDAGFIFPTPGAYEYPRGAVVDVDVHDTNSAYTFRWLLLDGNPVTRIENGRIKYLRSVSIEMLDDHEVIAVYDPNTRGILYSPRSDGRIICDDSGGVMFVNGIEEQQ